MECIQAILPTLLPAPTENLPIKQLQTASVGKNPAYTDITLRDKQIRKKCRQIDKIEAFIVEEMTS